MAIAPEVFVGRHHEIEALSTALDAACAGGGRLVLLAGEPGIGKTRTALELTAHANANNARIVWGRCHEEAGAPSYWPWVQILRAVARLREADELRSDLDAGAADIAGLVPEIQARLPDLDPPAGLSDPSEARFRLFDSIARFLINTSLRQSLVLVLDDLHWADIPSLRLLEFLAQEMADSRLLVVCTYRETELSRQHRLSNTLGALTRIRHAIRLHLSGLNADDVRDYVATAAGMVPPAWLTHAIHGQTEGNPLFVREVVHFLAQEGHFSGLAPVTATGSAIWLPEGVREVIGRRLNRLSAACNDILATASVVGREFALDVLMRASDPRTEEVVLEALDEAITAHIIEETEPGTYQFTHALVRITLYDELRTGQRRRLHHAVGEAIEAVHRRNPDPVLADLGYHFRASGMAHDLERAIDYSIRAGQSAGAAVAFEDEINLFQNALDMLDTLSNDDPERRCNVLLLLGNAQRKANDHPQSLVTLRAASGIARTQQMWVAMATAANIYADIVWRNDAQFDAQAGLLLEEALDCLPENEAAWRIRLMGSLARDWLHSGRVEESKELAARAIAKARQLGDPAALAASLAGLADYPWHPHDAEQMLAEASELATVGERANDLEVALRGHFRRASLLLALGDIREVEATEATIARLNARLRQPFFTVWELGLKATMALMRGALVEAEGLIIRSMKTQLQLRTQITDPVSLVIFTLRREQGRLQELGPMVTTFTRQRAGSAIWQPGLALLYVELGDLDAARTVFAELATDNFAALPRDGRWVTCIMYLAEVCVALDDADRASVLYRLLSPWSGHNIVMGGGTGFWGASDRFLGMLAAVGGHWTDAERHFAGALTTNQRCGALGPLGHTRRDYADMLLRRGFPGDAAKAAGQLDAAAELADTLGLTALAGKVAALRDRLTRPTPKSAVPDNLTARELEVLRLLAIGRGNADIALVLEIGQSTVATHVHNILVKTGCANRTEAAAYAVRHRLHIC